MNSPRTDGITRRALVAGAVGTALTAAAGAVSLGRRQASAASSARTGGLELVAAAKSRPIDRMTLHHTACGAASGGRQVDAAVLGEWHRRRGLGLGTGDSRDCAYHYVILPDGQVQPGRPVEYWGSGTQSGADNMRSIAVALVGDFSPEHNRGRFSPARPTAEQMRSLEGLAVWAFGNWGFGPESVRGHREVAASECPGELCVMDVVRGRLRAAVDAGRPGVQPPRRTREESA